MVKFCKEELPQPLSVTIVSNGSLITQAWMRKYGKYVDILAISCDSFSEDTNKQIGRVDAKHGNQADVMQQVAKWCAEFEVVFKMNTVSDASWRPEIQFFAATLD